VVWPVSAEYRLLVGKKGPLLYQLLRRARPGGARRSKPDKLEKIAMKFRPLHDRVMIRRIDAAGKTTGGIIIPDTAQEKPMEGEIVAVGPGARDEKGNVVPLSVKAGDRILFGKWSGTEIKIDGEDLLIMTESDIMGVIDAPSIAKKKAA
jgi:chaperonin GroES